MKIGDTPTLTGEKTQSSKGVYKRGSLDPGYIHQISIPKG